MRSLFVLLTAFGLLCAPSGEARNLSPSSFGRNHYLLMLSYGFPARLYHNKSYPVIKGSPIGPIALGIELPVHQDIGIRLMVQDLRQRASTTADRFGFPTYYETYSRSTGLGSMACYHLHRLLPGAPKLDVYAGLGVGFFYDRETLQVGGSVETAVSGRVLPMTAIGLRYYFLRKLAVFAEGGYTGLSYVNAGLTIHLPN